MLKDLRHFPVTYGLLIWTSFVFLALQLVYLGHSQSWEAIFNFGGLYGVYLKANPHEIWRFFSPIFVHIGWQHFLLNSLSIYFVGKMAEQIWGSRNFLTLYLLAGAFGNLVTLFFTPDVVAAGASTSLFGLFTAIAILGYFGSNPYLRQLGRSYQTLILFNLIFSLLSPEVSLAGHLGGALGGGLLAVIIPSRLDRGVFSKSQTLQALLTFLVLSLVLLFLSFN